MTRFDRISLASVVGLAAFLRLPGLESRGRFDADQGHDMLTLVAFVREGVVPLLGPKASVGEFHHGAFYYFLLAPSAWLSNGDPVAVTFFLALLGIAAVVLTWWLARAIGGPLAGFIAGMLLAVSPAAIEESIFIWNPNPIGFLAALALAAAWRAHTGGSAGWWALAVGAAGAVVQLHVLGVVFFVAILALGPLELRQRRTAWHGLVGGLGIVVVLFLPLIVHELQTGFLETRGMIAYLRAGDEPGAGPVSALVFTLLRVVGWPLIGLVTDQPQLAAVVLAVTIGLIAVGLRTARGAEATGLRWLIGVLAWSTISLAFAAPSLQRVVAGLPNDHYHAFLDPIVVSLIAVPAAGLWARSIAAWAASRRPPVLVPAVLVPAVAIGVVLVLLVTVAALRKPPMVDPDRGWAAARAAGARIVQVAGPRPVHVIGLPDFKLADGIIFPVVYAGGQAVGDPQASGGLVVVACDRLFEAAIGARCGGPAEDLEVGLELGAVGAGALRLVDRFDASPRTAISIYGPAVGP